MKKSLVLFMCTFVALSLSAQKVKYFTDSADGFSKKKTSYITLNDGTVLEGNIKKLKRKKMLFEEIHLEIDGKKKEIKAEEIKSMYLPQSGFDKFGKGYSNIWDSTTWSESSDLNQEYLKDGYAYFEATEVYYKKKKTKVLLLQLLNPSFTNNVKVFYDPLAAESGGMGIGGIKVTESVAKSYFIKVGDDVAFKLKKKSYKDEAENVYRKCPDFYKSIKKDLNWKDLGKVLSEYSQSCS